MTASDRRRGRPSSRRPRGRANREGSIYPYRNGYAAYVWVTTPSGKPARKYVYGQTREIVHEKWVKLQAKAEAAPVPTSTPTLAQYLTRWLAEVVEPNLEPATYAYYETMARLYIIPALGAQAARPAPDARRAGLAQQAGHRSASAAPRARTPPGREGQQRCCAIGACCQNYPGRRTVQAARNTLRAALNHAKTSDELVSRNVARYAKVPSPPRRRRKGSVVDRRGGEPVPGLGARRRRPVVRRLRPGPGQRACRKGEVLGLTWSSVDLDSGEARHRLAAPARPQAS